MSCRLQIFKDPRQGIEADADNLKRSDRFSIYAALIHNLSTAMFANMNPILCGLFTKIDCANTIPQHWWAAWNLRLRAWSIRLHAYSSGQFKYCVLLWEKWGRLTNKRWSDRMTWIGSGERARDGVPQTSCGLGPNPFCKDSIATAIIAWSYWSTPLYLFFSPAIT